MSRVAYAPAAVFVGIMLTAGTTAAQNQNADFFMSEPSAARSAGSIAAEPDWRSVMFRIYGAQKNESDGRWVLDDAE